MKRIVGKENNNEHEATFSNLEMKKKDGKIKIGFFDKKNHFFFRCLNVGQIK